MLTQAKDKALELKQAGNAAYQAGRYDEAVQLYTQALKIYPHQDEVLAVFLCNRAAAYLQLKAYDQVVEDTTQALGLNANYTKALHRRSQAYENMGRRREALRDFQKILSLPKVNEDTRASTTTALQRVLTQLAQQRLQARLDELAPVSLLPCTPVVAEFLNLLDLPAPSQSLADLDLAIASAAEGEPELGEMHYQKALAMIAAQQYDGVLAQLRQAVALLQAQAETQLASLVAALNLQAIFAYLSIEPEECDKAFNEALQLDEKNARTYVRFALCLHEWHGRELPTDMAQIMDKGMAMLRKAVELGPEDKEVLCIQGKITLALHVLTQGTLERQHPEFSLANAQKALQKSIDLGHKGFMPHLHLGLAKQMGGQNGMEVMDKALERFPDQPFLQCQILDLQMQMNQANPAALNTHIQKLVELVDRHPKYPLGLLSLANVMLMTGHVDEGRARIEQALAVCGRSPELLMRSYHMLEAIELGPMR